MTTLDATKRFHLERAPASYQVVGEPYRISIPRSPENDFHGWNVPSFIHTVPRDVPQYPGMVHRLPRGHSFTRIHPQEIPYEVARFAARPRPFARMESISTASNGVVNLVVVRAVEGGVAA